ncbi:MAG: cytochrome c3 family protein [Syntrophales bacterium]|nr:cytochrome c3 family protein [Syntrophales bacterium]
MKEQKKKKIDYRQLISLIKGLLSDKVLGRKLGFGLIGILVIGMFASFLALSRTVGGGDIKYTAKGSPGPVTFSHLSHTKGKKAKYQCEDCHENPFNTEAHSGFIIQLFKDSDRVVRIGRESHRVMMAPAGMDGEAGKIIEVERAERLCASGECHNGRESFSKLECLKCHQRR